MVLEPGPATPFDLAKIDLSIEPLLDAADYDIKTPGLDDIGAVIDTNVDTANQGILDLTLDTFNLSDNLDAVATSLNEADLVVPSSFASDVIAGQADVEQAIDDAAASIPEIVSPPDVPGTVPTNPNSSSHNPQPPAPAGGFPF